MPSVVRCPSCERPLQIPEELRGRPVRCPACGQVFMLPPNPEQDEQEGQPEVDEAKPLTALPAPDSEETKESGGRRTGRVLTVPEARARVFAGGICLVLLASWGLLSGVLLVVQCMRGNPPDLSEVRWPDEKLREQAKELMKGPVLEIGGGIIAGLHFVILLAARQIFALRYWTFAMTGCILAILGAVFTTWCIGIPLAIYPMAVLLDPRVREAFQ